MPASDPQVTIVDGAGASRQVSLDAYLDPAAIEAAEREANAWIKRLRRARIGDQALRDRFTYRGDSL